MVGISGLVDMELPIFPKRYSHNGVHLLFDTLIEIVTYYFLAKVKNGTMYEKFWIKYCPKLMLYYYSQPL